MDYDITIIGAGAVGLAVGNSLLSLKKNFCLLEKNESFGQEISSRNSEVIHSGIYYDKSSLKSKLCIEGNKLLYDYCKRNKIQFNKCGKLIVSNRKDKLVDLKKNADFLNIACTLLSKDDIRNIDPLINAKYALHIYSSGVFDSHAFMTSLKNKLYNNSIDIAFKTSVVKINKKNNGYLLTIINPDNSVSEISTKFVINCAGLYSYHISSLIGLNKFNKLHYWKGSYFWIDNIKAKKIKSLIYPVPERNLYGLGIHITKDINGRIKLGPDSEYLGTELSTDYFVDEKKQDLFFQSVKNYLPFLKKSDLKVDYSGIRPKLQKPGETFKDFIIQNEETNNFKNFINLIGIESPGLTSCLAIGNYVKNLL